MLNLPTVHTDSKIARESRPRRAKKLALIPAAFLIHNLEEALTIPTMLPSVTAKLEIRFGFPVVLPSPNQYYVMLALLTLAVFLFWLFAMNWETLCYGLVAFQATMTLNVLSHIGGTIVLTGYAPGVLTAVFVELVVSIIVFQHLKREAWLSKRQWWLLAPLALLLHGPILYGGLMLVTRL
jgi:Protein of unknown function with HXXEE motif